MSHLATTYALACGVCIDKPFILDTFFPLDHPLDKTILVHAFAGAIAEQNGQKIATFTAKIYSHFSEVVRLLKPIVEPLGYKFVQIGGKDEPPLQGIDSLCGKTSYHQSAYLVKNAKLLIGNDSMWTHVRGSEYKPLLCVYGSTDTKNHGPYWNNPSKTSLIESHRGGKKPTYSSQEFPKTIDWITPEKIANEALRLLDIAPSITHKTYYFGPDHLNVSFEIIPNMVVNPQMNIGVPVIRMDYHFDEAMLAQNLQVRKCAVITDREINLELLLKAKSQIHTLRIEVDKVSGNWIKTVKRIGIPVQAVTRERDEEKVRALRLALYDVCLFDTMYDPTVENLKGDIATYLNKPLDTDSNLATLSFRTNRFFLSNSKIYLSSAHWRADQSVESLEKNTGTVIDDPSFWAEQRSFYLFDI